MRRRYYRNTEDDITDFLAWSMLLTGKGIVALIEMLTRPGAYTPAAPDDPTQVSGWLEQAPSVDWSQTKLPKINLGSLKPPKKIGSFKDLKDAARGLSEDLKSVEVSWSAEDRPQIIPKSEQEHPFTFPEVVGEPRAYRIYPPHGEANPQASVNLMQALVGAAPRLTFEIVADGRETVWQVCDYEGRYPPQILIDHLRTHHPGVVVETADPNDVPKRQYPFYRHLLLFGLTNEYAAPLPFFSDHKAQDMLLTLSRRMDFLDPALDERVQYQLFSLTYSMEASNRAIKRLMRGTVRPTSGIVEDKDDPLRGFDVALLNAKIDSRLYHTFLAVTVESRDERRLAELAQIAHDVMQVRLSRYNGLTLVGSQELKRRIDSEEQAALAWFETLLTAMVKSSKPEWRRLLSVLSPQEMATLWHLPDETYPGANIRWASVIVPTELVAQGEVRPDRVIIGDYGSAGRETPIALPINDQASHQYLAGKTGVGKSTLMLNLIAQDIAAGRGLAVIDPHGKLVDDLLARCIPEARRNDVVLLDCGRDDHPVPLNPFRIPAGVKFASAFNYVYWVTRKIYHDIWLDGQTDMVMRNVIQALLCDPEATPLDIRRLFMEDRYRKQVVTLMRAHEKVSLDALEYWHEFDRRSAGDKRETAKPVFNRTRAFLGNRTLELMTCHPKGLPFQQYIREQKIVLIRLSGEEIVHEAGALGAMFLSGFYLASEALGYLDDGVPPRYSLYMDEVERFITSPLPDMFAQARKFGLALTLANQFLDQLSSETYKAIVGSVGTHFLFELGIKDAETLAALTEPEVEAETLSKLGFYRMAVRTRLGGKPVPPFIVATRRPPKAEGAAFTPAAPDLMTGEAVRAWLMARLTPEPTPEPEPKPEKTPKQRTTKATSPRKLNVAAGDNEAPTPPKPKRANNKKVTDYE